MGYAFISYSTKNQASADAMRELFNKHNIDTWMAPYDIPAGSKYAAVITKAIRDCSCFVLLLSNDSQASEAVDSEVELATLRFKKSIITVELEKVILNDAFTFYIHNKQIIAAHKIDEESREIKQILEAVRAYTNVNEEIDINSDIMELREKYPNDVSLLNKFLNTYFKQQESIFINNCDFEKRRDYIAFFKKYFGENVFCIEMQQFLDEMVSRLSERKSLDDFYAKHKTYGVLIINDFQFCFGKKATQETVCRILKYRSENKLSTIIFSYNNTQDISSVVAKCLIGLLATYEKFGIITEKHPTVASVIEERTISDIENAVVEDNIDEEAVLATQGVNSSDSNKANEIVLTAEQHAKNPLIADNKGETMISVSVATNKEESIAGETLGYCNCRDLADVSKKEYSRNLVVPEKFTAISEYALEGASWIENIYIPKSVKSIHRNAFMHLDYGVKAVYVNMNNPYYYIDINQNILINVNTREKLPIKEGVILKYDKSR